MTPRQRHLAAAAAAVVAILAGAAVALLQRPSGPAVATVYIEPRALPDYALLDHRGKTVGREAFAGRWTWVFFGFTHCPDVCPMTLSILAAARGRIEPAQARPDVVLVSVDPERDTPEVLARYVAHFDPQFGALTGTREAIDAFAAALYVAHAKVPQGDSYTVDHYAGVFLVDPQARVVAVTGPPHSAEIIASDYLALRKAHNPQ